MMMKMIFVLYESSTVLAREELFQDEYQQQCHR
jgi:hypothetical protein